MNKKNVKILIVISSLILTVGILFFVLVWNGVVLLNQHRINKYAVKGVDVSSYQGKIDWHTLASQDISFAFIKATEGSTFVDKNFAYNFEEAQKTTLAVGAYHFFSYDSSGETQAEDFINTVIPFDGMLPPVVDVEFYGDYVKNPTDRENVENQLKVMLTLLEEHYNQKPIIYATEKSYKLYLSNDYDEYDIWIRNVITKPSLSDDREWTFWQYTNREKLNGYSGREKYIDVNVFTGSAEDYNQYLKTRTYKKQENGTEQIPTNKLLSDGELAEIVAPSLGVPDKKGIEYAVSGEMYYFEAADCYYKNITFTENGEIVAYASVNPHTGELLRNIFQYNNINANNRFY